MNKRLNCLGSANAIAVLLHCHVNPGCRPHHSAPAIRDATEHLLAAGLIESSSMMVDGAFSTTRLGENLVDAMCKMEIPELPIEEVLVVPVAFAKGHTASSPQFDAVDSINDAEAYMVVENNGSWDIGSVEGRMRSFKFFRTCIHAAFVDAERIGRNHGVPVRYAPST